MEKLWYQKPADEWEEALPLGNGRLGAMVFGQIQKEQIQVNEESIWYGKRRERINPDAKENLPKIREYIRNGQIQKAQKLMSLAMTGCPYGERMYQTLGDISIEMDLPEEKIMQILMQIRIIIESLTCQKPCATCSILAKKSNAKR